MVASSNTLLYERIVDITRQYLGPAAERFIARQIVNHLDKSPEELKPRDLGALIDWLKLSMAFLTNDEAIINRYVAELRAIETTHNRRTVVGGKSKA